MNTLRTSPFRNLNLMNTLRGRKLDPVKHLSTTEKSQNSTINPKDVENHAKLSEKWWDANGELGLLHALNPLRIQFLRDGLANSGIGDINPCLPLQGIKILDVGCGGGILTEPLARIGAEVTGLDASPELIQTAMNHAKLDPIVSKSSNYVCAAIEDFSNENEEIYDAIIASEVLEHVSDKELFLKHCTKVLKPGGSLFITTINRTLPSWFGGIIAVEYILRLVSVGTHDWNSFISPNEVRRLLDTCGCKTRLIHGMYYNPFKSEWLWTTSTAINYALHAIKQGKGKSK